jgi:hypothetical protein
MAVPADTYVFIFCTISTQGCIMSAEPLNVGSRTRYLSALRSPCLSGLHKTVSLYTVTSLRSGQTSSRSTPDMNIFAFSQEFRPVLGPTHLPIGCVLGLLLLRLKRLGREANDWSLMLRLRVSGSIPPFTHVFMACTKADLQCLSRCALVCRYEMAYLIWYELL